MLTADLVRASISKGVVKPRYLTPGDPATVLTAERLTEVFAKHVGRQRRELDEAIADLIGDSPDYAVTRGLAHLLSKKTTIETSAAADPVEVRKQVFAAAADVWPVGPATSGGPDGSQGPGAAVTPRELVLERVAQKMGISAPEVEAALFGDLEKEQVITGTVSWDAESLVNRYNLALAQGVLLKATEVRVTLEGVNAKRARQLFRMLKFHRLMHRAEKVDGAYRVILSGPLSLFQQTTRYGLQLALFLPTLCHCSQWTLDADVVWGKGSGGSKGGRALRFEADQDTGLVTHTRDLGTWEADEERHFRASFKALKTDWTLRRGVALVDLDGRGVLVPDYVLAHPDGRKALLDIVWFWRKRSFESRQELLADAGPSNLIVALATKYNADPKGTEALGELPGEVYRFRGVIQPKKIVAAAERVGL